MRKYKYIVLEGQGTTNRKEPVEEWEYWAPKRKRRSLMDQDKAHILATKLYDYRTASDNYYKSLKKPKRSSDDK